VPSLNESILYGVVCSFAKAFGGRTVYMRVFDGYFPVTLMRDYGHSPYAREFASKFLPKGITLEEAEALGRIGFFNKFAEVFASDGGSLSSSW
jgi:hypothetical protein